MPTSLLTLANQHSYAEVEALRGKAPSEIHAALEQAFARAATISTASTSNSVDGRADTELTEVLSLATIESIVALVQGPTVEAAEAEDIAIGEWGSSTDRASSLSLSRRTPTAKPTLTRTAQSGDLTDELQQRNDATQKLSVGHAGADACMNAVHRVGTQFLKQSIESSPKIAAQQNASDARQQSTNFSRIGSRILVQEETSLSTSNVSNHLLFAVFSIFCFMISLCDV